MMINGKTITAKAFLKLLKRKKKTAKKRMEKENALLSKPKTVEKKSVQKKVKK
ncbi:MAG: hypothetical protein KAG10_02675 [Methylococcales bacterium]|nr:hypothetical protein [Methylococcales bacterium]